MSGSSEKNVTVKGKTSGKKGRQPKVEGMVLGKPEFQEQGMSKAWQQFYVRVKEVVEE